MEDENLHLPRENEGGRRPLESTLSTLILLALVYPVAIFVKTSRTAVKQSANKKGSIHDEHRLQGFSGARGSLADGIHYFLTWSFV